MAAQSNTLTRPVCQATGTGRAESIEIAYKQLYILVTYHHRSRHHDNDRQHMNIEIQLFEQLLLIFHTHMIMHK
jgi:hypothetical protein